MKRIGRQQIKKKYWHSRRWLMKNIGPWLAKALGFLCLASGLAGLIEGPLRYPPFPSWVIIFHREISTTLVGIGITVLVIDAASGLRASEQEKRNLISLMGSSDNARALHAIHKLRERYWDIDGSLRGADLTKADLDDAVLKKADLRFAILKGAEMKDIDLTDADLRDANLLNADLSDANLINTLFINPDDMLADPAEISEAIFTNADFTGAKVTKEQLRQADTLKGATMPDGEKFSEDWLKAP